MQTTLISIGYIFAFWVLGFNGLLGQSIQFRETIQLGPAAKFQISPTSFCITEDKLFLFPDLQNGTIKICREEANFFTFVIEFGPSDEAFSQPRYCFYSQSEGKLGVIDYGLRKGFIFKRVGPVDFRSINTFECSRFGYDIKFAGDGIQTIVSGYITDKEGNPFDLYSINSETGQIDFLLSSPEKHGLSLEVYLDEYYRKQTLPAIGIKGFFDVQWDYMFYVWEGALRIIKFNLRTKKITKVFGHETSHYTKPDGARLSESYIKGDFDTTWKLQEKYSYVRNIFVTANNVYVVYETGKRNDRDVSIFRLQIYTLEGEFLNDVLIPVNPGRKMWLDKESSELYTLTNGVVNSKGDFEILKYKLN